MLTIDATNLPRFMQCNAYLQLQTDPIFAERDNTIREEGNAAHWLALVVFNGQHTLEELIDRKAPNGVFITPEMADHVSDYLSCINRNPHVSGNMEWSHSFSGANWQVNGRTDFLCLNGHLLNIDDFKYGYSIVEPEMDWTMIAHAIGYCLTTGFQPQQITFTIHQPRASHHAGHVRSWSISYNQLMMLHSELSAALSNPSNMLNTGKHCYKCPSFVGCPARQNAEMNGLEASHMAYNADMSDAALEARMSEIHRAKELLKQSEKAYEEQMMHRLRNGSVFKGYKIENQLTNRVWNDYVTPDLMRALTGINVAKSALVTPAQAERNGIPKEIVNMHSDRRSKGFKLARVDANKHATKLFGDKSDA